MGFIIKDSILKGGILIIDFCSQYTQLIARRVRELGVYCEVIFFWNITKKDIFIRNPAGVILSGSPQSVNRKSSEHVDCDDILRCIFRLNIPVLGICYGMHIIVERFGGTVCTNSTKKEFGFSQLEIITDSVLVKDIYDSVSVSGRPVLNVWMSHSDTVISVPNGFVIVGITKKCNIAIIENQEKNLYGLQFHPEVTHTTQGRNILKRFVFKICFCRSFWCISNILDYLVTDIRSVVKTDGVLLAFSGGIDSLVTALLLRRAIGNDKLICCFIDTGLLRYDNPIYIRRLIQKYGLNVLFVSAEERFFNALVGVCDAEKKRKIIGKVFVEIFEDQKKNLPEDIRWLAQGTIYPDIIESGGSSDVIVNKNFIIKSHHNVGGISIIKSMKLLEPIKSLFKDEVRELGKELGISYDILFSHPFPGPGLGIRILGEVSKEYCNLLRRADHIFIEELKICNLYTKISQAFAVFLPVRSVGIMGDIRKYEWVVALRAVESVDFMTARWANLSYDFLCKVSTRIINEVDGVSRVVYDISNKPPSTIEWE